MHSVLPPGRLKKTKEAERERERERSLIHKDRSSLFIVPSNFTLLILLSVNRQSKVSPSASIDLHSPPLSVAIHRRINTDINHRGEP